MVASNWAWVGFMHAQASLGQEGQAAFGQATLAGKGEATVLSLGGHMSSYKKDPALVREGFEHLRN